MNQQSDIRRHFVRIEQDIDDALHTCEENAKFPRNLKASVTQWKMLTLRAKKMIQSNDQSQIHHCVIEMEEIGKMALAALDEIIGPDTKIRNCVTHANSELTNLKRQLH